MNKAFVREPEFDGRLFCPLCQTLGVAVGAEALIAACRPCTVRPLRPPAERR